MGKRNEKRRYSEKRNTSDHLVPIASPTPLANLSLDSVLLYDWWLCTAEPRGLAIGGFECRGRQGQRVLCSAAIAKRHDATTLETTDGFTVVISGFINSSRTLENGFSLKVCSHFLFGFPYDWEEYASRSECSSNEESVCSGSNAIPVLPPLDKLSVPIARMRDLLLFSAGDSEKLVFDHMLQKLSPHDSQNAVITANSNTGNKHLKVCPYSTADGENSNCQKKVKVTENDIDDNNMSYSRSKTTVESKNEDQSRIGVGSITQTIGVKTRSMTRLKQERAGLGSSVSHEKNLSERLAADAKCLIRELRPDAVVAQIAPIEDKSQALQCRAKFKTVIAIVDASSLAGPEVKDSVARLVVDDGETTNHCDNRRISKNLQ
ncbi:hypothetical protein V6N13_060118 [Hibiscus sabdariffa]